MHRFFESETEVAFSPKGIPDVARGLAAPVLRDSTSGQGAIAETHATSDEWDLMGRTFTAWALANMALRDPEQRTVYLAALDRILEGTQKLVRDRGFRYFLLPYGKGRSFRTRPERSLFVDGELALVMGLRRLVSGEPDGGELARKVDSLAAQMDEGPVLSGESYPDECWTFCNAVALAAMQVADAVDGTDHRALARRWVQMARERLVDEKTGLLVSRYSYDGTVMEGPEGSTIWMAAHALSIVDLAFAKEQYERAKKELARSTFGFGYAVEWPESARGHADIDSGPIVPFFGVSAGSSGLALVGAKTFGDKEYFGQLMTTLDMAAFPVKHGDALRFAASNPAGDAVILYASVLGPAWDRVRERARP
jgi:hypothetical protein